MTTAVTVLALVLRTWSPDPEEEVRFWSVVYGVDPAVALAVHDAESGQAPEPVRDRVVSQGNYGRFQVRCTTWKTYFRLRECADLLDRHRNIRIGVRILRLFQDRFASGDGRRCRCSNGARHHWIAHYNEGLTVVPGGRGERYARIVMSRSPRVGWPVATNQAFASSLASRARALFLSLTRTLPLISSLGGASSPPRGED